MDSKKNKEEFYVQLQNAMDATAKLLNKRVEAKQYNLDNISILFANKISELSRFYKDHDLDFFQSLYLTSFILAFLSSHLLAGQYLLEMCVDTKFKNEDIINGYRRICDFIYNYKIDENFEKSFSDGVDILVEASMKDPQYVDDFIKDIEEIKIEVKATLLGLELTDWYSVSDGVLDNKVNELKGVSKNKH